MLAYRGIRAHHGPFDTFFSIILFSLLTTFVFSISKVNSIVINGGFSIAISLLLAIFWRVIARDLLSKICRKIGLSWADDDPSALVTLTANSRYAVTQVAVHLQDGTILRCDDTSKFNNAPFGPILIGPNGDVALYLTHRDPADGSASVAQQYVVDPNYGFRITYVPASQIKILDLRHR